MTAKPVFICDVDGVLADFLGPTLGVINRLADRNFTPSDVREWDIVKALGVGDWEKQIYAELTAPGFCRALPTLPGAEEAVAQLQELTELHFVTSPMSTGKTWAHEREAWLMAHFGVRSKQVHHSSGKHLFRGDFFLDDKPEHVVGWKHANPDYEKHAMLWSAPYNVLFETGMHITRKREWDEVLDLVEAAVES